MDDLEHSVLIAERDWDIFYEESEECNIQQARLAGQDDSGLSDTDDEKTSTQAPALPLQTNPGKPEKCDAAAPRLTTEDNCETGNPSEDAECVCNKTDLGQTAPFSLNPTTYAHLTIENRIYDISPGDKQNNSSGPEYVRESDQSQKADKAQELNESVTSSCEEKAFTTVLESSATPKKEKERWFVTVNDSSVQHSVYSGTLGQKNRIKKKNFKKLGHQSRAMEGECPHSNKKKEAEGGNMKKAQKEQKCFKLKGTECTLQKCTEPLYFNKRPDGVDKEIFSGSSNIQQVKEPSKEAYENGCVLDANCTFAVQCFTPTHFEINDVATQNLEHNPSPSLYTKSSSIPKQNSQLQANNSDSFMTQLVNDQSTIRRLSKEPECITDITTQNQQMTKRFSPFPNDPKENKEHHTILKNSSNTTPSNKLQQQQEYSTQFNNEEVSLQETQNHEAPNGSLETAVNPSHPIYALSSFWDKMESLTINDILHLRITNSNSPLSGSFGSEDNKVNLRDKYLLLDWKDSKLQESSLVDDTADSDYFTLSDDSKPDRSSCEFSTLSDFDEEFLQIINTSTNPNSEPQNSKEQSEVSLESIYKTDFLPKEEFKPTSVKNECEAGDLMMMCPQGGIPLYLYPATEAQGLFLTHEPDNNRNLFEGIRKAPSPVLSVDNVLDDQRLHDQTRSPDRCNSVVSFYSSKKLSVPETYDEFFSDFAVGNLLFPSVEDQTVPVPIFSSSRSVVTDLVFPEVEELIDLDIEDGNSPIRVMAHFDTQTERSTNCLEEPNLYFFASQRRNWRNFLSLRSIRFIGKGSIWCQKVSSWIFPNEITSWFSRAQPMPHLFNTGYKALMPCIEQQEHVQHTASERESILFSIKQADICLVCIAFASWVLKSSNPQSTDMWKAALLANVSAISAIQYLRQYVKKEITEDDA